jgi:hypothetical protein
MSTEKDTLRAVLVKLEQTVLDAHELLESHVGDEWRFKGRSTRSEGSEDQLVYRHELHEAGPFMVATDPQGRVGQWAVQLVRSRVTELVDIMAVTDGEASTVVPAYSTTTDVQLHIYDESGPLDPFVDPLAPIVRAKPTMVAELATLSEVPESVVDYPRDVLVPDGMSELGASAAYEEQVFCLGWLKACFAPSAEAGPAPQQ